VEQRREAVDQGVVNSVVDAPHRDLQAPVRAEYARLAHPVLQRQRRRTHRDARRVLRFPPHGHTSSAAAPGVPALTASEIVRVPGSATPSRRDALPCGSMSTTRTRCPAAANASANRTVVVVFPTPPLLLPIAIRVAIRRRPSLAFHRPRGRHGHRSGPLPVDVPDMPSQPVRSSPPGALPTAPRPRERRARRCSVPVSSTTACAAARPATVNRARSSTRGGAAVGVVGAGPVPRRRRVTPGSAPVRLAATGAETRRTAHRTRTHESHPRTAPPTAHPRTRRRAARRESGRTMWPRVCPVGRAGSGKFPSASRRPGVPAGRLPSPA